MRKLLSALLICACLSVYSQVVNDFSVVIQELNIWYSSIESASSITFKEPKSIDFTTQHYSINGVMAKGVLCDGTIAKFYETASLVPNHYERSIDWEIGIGESLFGGRYVQKMAPAHLIFSKLKPIE